MGGLPQSLGRILCASKGEVVESRSALLSEYDMFPSPGVSTKSRFPLTPPHLRQRADRVGILELPNVDDHSLIVPVGKPSCFPTMRSFSLEADQKQESLPTRQMGMRLGYWPTLTKDYGGSFPFLAFPHRIENEEDFFAMFCHILRSIRQLGTFISGSSSFRNRGKNHLTSSSIR